MFDRLSVRYVVAAWLTLGMMLCFATRSNFSVAIVSMTDVDSNSTNTINWNTAEKGAVLGAFFYGYVIGNIFFGFIAHRLSPRLALVVSSFISGLATVVFPPVSIYLGYSASFITRIILGLGEAPLYPSVFALISSWAPENERSRMFSFITSGCAVGPAIMMAGTGALTNSWTGWPGAFYIPGACLILWGLLSICVVVDSPDKHKSISVNERMYIESGRTFNSNKKCSVPWLELARCIPFWAILITGMSFSWGYWAIQTMTPTYLKGVLNLDILQNGVVSAAVNLATFCMNWIFPYFDHLLTTHFNLSLTLHRKFWSSVAGYGNCIVLLLLAFVNVSDSLAIALLIVSGGLTSAACIGYNVAIMDLSPNFAGVTVSFINGLVSVTSIAGPTVAGLMIGDERSSSEWQKVFSLSAAIFAVGNTIFLIFGSSKEQKWNVVEKEMDTV